VKLFIIAPNYRFKYNSVHEQQIDALRTRADCIVYGEGRYLWGQGWHVPSLIKHFYGDSGPDCVFIQHARHLLKDLTGLDKIKILKVCRVVDYFPRNHEKKNIFFNKQKINICLFPTSGFIRAAKRFQKIGHLSSELILEWLPFAVNTDVYKPRPSITKRFDAFCLFAGGSSYPRREKVVRQLNSLRDLRIFARAVYGTADKIVHENYVRLINQSRIGVTSNDKWGSVNFKHLEYAACGTLLLSDRAADMGVMGFKDNHNFIQYKDPAELPARIRGLLHDNRQLEITRHARQLICDHWSTDHAADKIITLIEKMR
jgi:Glycosyl transferases group 1